MKIKHYVLNIKDIGHICSMFGTSHELDEEFNSFYIRYNDEVVNRFYYKSIDIKEEIIDIEVDFVETYTITIELPERNIKK